MINFDKTADIIPNSIYSYEKTYNNYKEAYLPKWDNFKKKKLDLIEDKLKVLGVCKFCGTKQIVKIIHNSLTTNIKQILLQYTTYEFLILKENNKIVLCTKCGHSICIAIFNVTPYGERGFILE